MAGLQHPGTLSNLDDINLRLAAFALVAAMLEIMEDL